MCGVWCVMKCCRLGRLMYYYNFFLYKKADKKEKAVEEVVTLDPKIGEGEEYFAVAHIFASFNDTFVVCE